MSVVQDIDTLIDYIWDNWDTTAVDRPDKIYRNVGTTNQIRLWMFRNGIELVEALTRYSLLDMRANANKEEDTPFTVTIRSYQGDAMAKLLFDEFVARFRDLAHTNEIGIYAFTQILGSSVIRTAFYGELQADILLTRRGKGHA